MKRWVTRILICLVLGAVCAVAVAWTEAHDSRFVPLAVILINTLFYAALWLGMFLGFSATRRAIRKRHGLCPLCAYDLRGDLETGCPECGWGAGVLSITPPVVILFNLWLAWKAVPAAIRRSRPLTVVSVAAVFFAINALIAAAVIGCMVIVVVLSWGALDF